MTWRETSGDDRRGKPPSNGKQKTGKPPTEARAKYEGAPVNDDVCAVSYLSESGFTLTSVLDFASGTVVSFASNEKELVPQRGMFEVAERRQDMELGIYSFGEATPDPKSGQTITAHERVKRLLDEIELADKIGLDVYGLGEHHRQEFVVSAPAVVLAAAATRTKRIRLTSAVSVQQDARSGLSELRDARPGVDAGRDHAGRDVHRVFPSSATNSRTKTIFSRRSSTFS